jgi:hypothetical protein
VEQAIAEPLASLAGPTFRVSIERVSAGYVGRVGIARADGDAVDTSARRVTASSCDGLVDILALTLVLAIAGQRDRAAGSSGAPPRLPADDGFEPDAATTTAALATGAEPDPDAAGSSDSFGAGARFAAFGSVLGDAGTLLALVLGVALGTDALAQRRAARARHGLAGADRSVEPGNPAAPGAEIGLVAGGLLVCAPLSTRLAGAQLAACVGAELGRLSGHCTRIDTSHSSTTWWSAPRADLAWRWALPAALTVARAERHHGCPDLAQRVRARGVGACIERRPWSAVPA